MLAPFRILFSDDQEGSLTSRTEDRTLGTFGMGPKTRPCVVMTAAPGEEVTICLMATWGGDSEKELPYAYEHFSVLVNQTAANDHDENVVHTTPRWRVKSETEQPQHLVTISFIPHRMSFERWEGRDRVYHMVDEEQINRISGFQDARIRTWNQRTEDEPGFLEEERIKWAKHRFLLSWKASINRSHHPDPEIRAPTGMGLARKFQQERMSESQTLGSPW